MALIGQAVSEEIFEIVDGRTDDGRTDDGRTPDHGHPIRSSCELNGSGELIKWGSKGYTLHGHVFVMSFITSTREMSRSDQIA